MTSLCSLSISRHGLIAHPGSGGRWLLSSLALTNIFHLSSLEDNKPGVVHGHHQEPKVYERPFYGKKTKNGIPDEDKLF